MIRSRGRGSVASVSEQETEASATPEAPKPSTTPVAPKPSPGRRPVWRIVVVSIVGVLALVLAGGAGWTAWIVRRPLPQVSGEISVPGLDGDVRVVRDARGIPQIYADSPEDLFRAQGYVQAQDRFFEMDYRRHVTSGRMAELVGNVEDAIEADKVTRTFGWRKVAEKEWETTISPETKKYLQAYADGVNAYLKGRSPAETALEYAVLGLSVKVQSPEPWDPIDSLAWLKAMAWDLRGNYDDELDRARAYSTVKDVARVNELFPAYPSDLNLPILQPEDLENPVSTEDAAAETQGVDALSSAELQSALAATDRALAAVPVQVGRGDGTGSNSWVVSGKYTASGKPLLANDPHLALSAPGIWAQIGLHCNNVERSCPFDVAGFSFAGFPGVIVGHNAKLAWGITNMGADVTDFFVERVRGETYLRDDEWKDLDVHTETIRVNGGNDIPLEVRRTVHGPIVSDVLDDMDAVQATPTNATKLGQYAVSLGWTALSPGHSADAVFALNTAADAEDMQAAAALFEAPAQNIVFATTDGHIGYQAPGKIPVRRQVLGPVPSDGTWPRPGFDSRYDWTGYVDPADMPRSLDPEEGFIVAANQEVLPAGTPPFLTKDWDYGFRSQRIRTLLTDEIKAGHKIKVETMNSIQSDDWSPFAAVLVPMLLDQEVKDSFEAAGQELLADWDYQMDTDSAAAAYFAAVWKNLLRITFWDDVPENMRPNGNSQWLAIVQGLLAKPNDPYWDDRQTISVVESRDEVLTRALESARLDLTVEMSKNPSDWRWGTLHKLKLEHPVLGGESIPGIVRGYFNPDPIEMPGGSSIVNATSWNAASGSFEVTAGPSLRMVVDLDDLDGSTWVTVTGSSGHPASTHYADQLKAWSTGTTYAWPFSASAVTAAKEDELTLTP